MIVLDKIVWFGVLMFMSSLILLPDLIQILSTNHIHMFELKFKNLLLFSFHEIKT